MTVIFDVGKVQAKSYLEQQPEFVQELAAAAAKAFVKARDREPARTGSDVGGSSDRT